MSVLSTQEKIECLKNLLADPDDWVSRRILELADEEDEAEETNARWELMKPLLLPVSAVHNPNKYFESNF